MDFLNKFDINVNKVICMSGLPGSGKSTITKELNKKGYDILCPDNYRYELAKKINGNEDKYESELQDILQSFNKEAWDITYSKLENNIKNKIPTVIDATFTTIKQRRKIVNFVKALKEKIDIICIDNDLETTLIRNLNRSQTIITYKNEKPIYGRYVPENVIKEKWLTQTLPTLEEGFRTIEIIYSDLDTIKCDGLIDKLLHIKNSPEPLSIISEMYDNGDLKHLIPELYDCWMLDQENKHHNLTLSEHMINSAKLLKNESLTLYLSVLLHDIGKPMTKVRHGVLIKDGDYIKAGQKVTVEFVNGIPSFVKVKFKNIKRNIDIEELLTIKHVALYPDCTYYNHALVGARMARRLLYRLELFDIMDDVYKNIVYHMVLPYQKINQKIANKIIKKYGKDMVLNLLKIRYADICSSNNTGEDHAIFFENKKTIMNIIEEKYV